MKLLQLKEFSEAEKAQLSGLSFCAGGNLRKSASNTRNRLREKQSKIYQHNVLRICEVRQTINFQIINKCL